VETLVDKIMIFYPCNFFVVLVCAFIEENVRRI